MECRLYRYSGQEGERRRPEVTSAVYKSPAVVPRMISRAVVDLCVCVCVCVLETVV